MPNYTEYDPDKLREELSGLDKKQLKVEKIIVLQSIAMSLEYLARDLSNSLEELKSSVDDISEAVKDKKE